MTTRTNAASRKTIIVAVIALAIAVSGLTITAVQAVTLPIYDTALHLAHNTVQTFKAL
jgi:hypothetical protein